MVTLSGAVYGKRRPFGPSLVREYELLSASQDFPEAAGTRLEQVARSFRWQTLPSCGGNGQLEPCFGIWWLANHGRLLIRFVDEGRDDQGRPHLLRMDAVYIPPEIMASQEQLAAWLGPGAWPQVDQSQGIVELLSLDVTSADSRLVSILQQHSIDLSFPDVGKSSPPAVIVGPHRSYVYQPTGGEKAVFVGPNSVQEAVGESEKLASSSPSPRTEIVSTSPARLHRAWMISRVVFLSTGLAATCVVLFVAWISSGREKKHLRSENYKLTNELVRAQNNLNSRHHELESRKEMIRKLEQQLSQAKTEIERLYEDNQKLGEVLVQKDPSERMRHLNEERSKLQIKINDAVRALNQVLEGLRIEENDTTNSPP